MLPLLNASDSFLDVAATKTLSKRVAKTVPRNAPRSTRTSSDPREVRSDDWSKEWLACFEKTEGSPQAFAKAVGISYQTLWRIGTQGADAGFKTKFQIRQWCLLADVKSPV